MATVLTPLIAVADKLFLTMSTKAVVVGLFLNIATVAVPPQNTALIRAESFFLSASNLGYRASTLFTEGLNFTFAVRRKPKEMSSAVCLH